MTLLSILLLGLPAFAQSAKWAVIAAGSGGYSNYRHQADACHAYQVMKKSGIPEENIILMMQDDVASSSNNPFPGKLFNKPGDNATDVYDGCKITYMGDIVTANLFSAVITGNTSGAATVLKSGPDDKVFITFIDHGGVGLVGFPNGEPLHVATLSENIKTMQSKKMFKEMVFYLEACESGSMFPDLTKNGKVLAVTAASGQESSWGTYCGSQAVVNGKSLHTCLGDLFSVSWMEDSDAGAFSSETLTTQIERVTTRTNRSHVMVFGDTSFEKEPIGNFEHKLQGELPGLPGDNAVSAWHDMDVHDVDVHNAYEAWVNTPASSEAKRAAWKRFMAVVAAREADEALFENIVKSSCSDVNMIGCVDRFRHSRSELKDRACHQKLVRTVFEECPHSEVHASPGGWNGFNMRFSQVLVNLCEGQEALGKDAQTFDQIVKKECGISRAKVENKQFIV